MRIFIISILLIALISCGSDDKKTDSSGTEQLKQENAETGPSALLSYKFKTGDKLNYRLTTDINNSQHIEADSAITAEINQHTEYQIQLNVNEISTSNIADVTVTIHGIKAKALANGQNIDYDSKYIYSTRERKMFMDYESLKNKSYSVKVNQFGEILDITDVDEIINEMIIIQDSPRKFTSEQKEMFKQQFVQSGIAPLTEQLFRSTSDKRLYVNSTWEQRYPSVIAGFEIENIATFKIAGFETNESDSLAKINANLAIQWSGQKDVTEEGVHYNFSDPNINGSGIIFFNISKGCIKKSETTIVMEMELTMESLDANQKPVKAYKKDRIVNKSKVELI